jgi:hypothetical protein
MGHSISILCTVQEISCPYSISTNIQNEGHYWLLSISRHLHSFSISFHSNLQYVPRSPTSYLSYKHSNINFIFTSSLRCHVMSCHSAPAAVTDVPADAGFLCGRAAKVRGTIVVTAFTSPIHLNPFPKS